MSAVPHLIIVKQSKQMCLEAPSVKSQRKTTTRLSKRNQNPNNCSHPELLGAFYHRRLAILEERWRALHVSLPLRTHTLKDRTTARVKKVKMCSDAWFYMPRFNVCLQFCKRHLALWVYWPVPFCLSCSDHQISHPLLHSLWTSKLCSQKWTDDGLQGH